MALFSQHTPAPSFRAPERPLAADTAVALLKRYRPIATRATGGFGSVEVCMDTRLKRRVAIKRIPLAQGNNSPAAAVQTALAEAQTAGMLQHPNIVSVIDFTFDSTYAYLVMEYIDGMSLEEFLAKADGNSLTYDETAAIADAIGGALAFAHENGVLHLDIKPGNVLIDRNGHIKLADFGMATLSRAAGFGEARGGTIGYMPPEQLDIETGNVDQRTDLFALAAVLYEGLCGTSPFRAATPANSLDRIIRGVVYPSDLLPEMPPAAETALVEALSPMPQDRQQSVADFCRAFVAPLGDPRAGSRSLAGMIAEITAAEEAAATGDAAPEEQPTFEIDPELGYLGTRFEQARPVAQGLLAGISTAVFAYHLLGSAGTLGGAALVASALAIGCAAGIAPQIGSALAATGFALVFANASIASAGIVASLAVIVLFCALAIAWWLVWGRESLASTGLVALLALALATGSALPAAGLATALVATFAAPAHAAAVAGFGSIFAILVLAADPSTQVLTTGMALEAFAQPALLLGVILATAGAALSAHAMQAYRNKAAQQPKSAAVALPLLCMAIVSFLLCCLARPMEIAAANGSALAGCIGAALGSSIICWICIYLFGYAPKQAEGDRL